jgi:hypothetical protein
MLEALALGGTGLVEIPLEGPALAETDLGLVLETLGHFVPGELDLEVTVVVMTLGLEETDPVGFVN